MTPLGTLQSLDVPTVTVVALAAASLALTVAEPVLGRRGHRRFLAELAGGATADARESVRVRFYRRWVLQGWAMAAGALALVLALPGVGPRELGLRAPDLDGLLDGGGSLSGEKLAGFLVGATAAVVASTVLLRLVLRRTGRLPMPGAAAVDPMLPRTSRGRRGWAALALTAGVTEEVTYRGLLLLTIALLAPTADRTVVLVAAAVLFGAAHWYQGPVGMLATGVVGGALGGLYLSTGSLLVPMVLHVLVDLRPLLLRVTDPAGTDPARTDRDGTVPAGTARVDPAQPAPAPAPAPASTGPTPTEDMVDDAPRTTAALAPDGLRGTPVAGAGRDR